ncbi:MAG: hypothetical protein Q9M14_05280 [Mariprofundaceae bacterium]|nr:hypothetical protein [Mariprofundaceae bacterium]
MMIRKLAVLALPCMMFGTLSASASTYSYMIDHGTPGVITSDSKMVRLVLIGSGDCREIPYNIIADGVSSLSGKLDLSKEVSFPMDFTVITLSCSKAGIKATLSKESASIFGSD